MRYHYENLSELVDCMISNGLTNADQLTPAERPYAIAAWMATADQSDLDEASMGEYLPAEAGYALSRLVCQMAADPNDANVADALEALRAGVWACARHWVNDALDGAFADRYRNRAEGEPSPTIRAQIIFAARPAA